MKSYFTNTILLVFALCCFGFFKVTAQCDPACPFALDMTQVIAYSYNPPGTTIYCEYDASGNCIESYDLAPLPVELVYFKATPKSQEVALSWQTSSEKDNHYFEILRSSDGRSYQSVGVVKAAGNSQEKIEYRLLDKAPAHGYNYYLLKQVDFDGSTSSSSLVTVFVRGAEDLVLLNQYYSNQQLYLQYHSNIKGKFDLFIFDNMGRKIKHREIYLQEGKNRLELDILQKGILFISLSNPQYRISHKVVKAF